MFPLVCLIWQTRCVLLKPIVTDYSFFIDFNGTLVQQNTKSLSIIVLFYQQALKNELYGQYENLIIL